MSFDAKNFVIDKVRRVTRFDLTTGAVTLSLISIENPQVEFTGENTDKTDAFGVLLNRFERSKGVNFSGEASTLSMPLLAAQLGSEVEDGTTTITGKTFDVVPVVSTTADNVTTITATLNHTPKTAPTALYTINGDGSVGASLAIGSDTGNATISGAVITLPDGFTGKKVGVLYDYETTDAVKVVDNGNEFNDPAGFIVEILAADVCNPATKRAGKLVFPKAKMDNNFTLNLTTEGTHPFGFTALGDYCDDDMELCYVLFDK